MSLPAIYNFLQLDDELATSGQPLEDELAEIAAAGFHTVINLAPHDADYGLADEAASVQRLRMEYIHIPVDWDAPTRERYERFAQALRTHKSRRVFVHCAANMRASCFILLYRVLQLQWPYERALGDVLKIWQPNAVWQRFIDAILNRSTVVSDDACALCTKLESWYRHPAVQARRWAPNLFWRPRDGNAFGELRVDARELEVLFATIVGEPSECLRPLDEAYNGRGSFIAINARRHELPWLTPVTPKL